MSTLPSETEAPAPRLARGLEHVLTQAGGRAADLVRVAIGDGLNIAGQRAVTAFVAFVETHDLDEGGLCASDRQALRRLLHKWLARREPTEGGDV